MSDLTLYTLMGEDHEIEAFLNAKNKRILMGIENENQEIVFSEEVHPYGWESLVLFAQQVIDCNERIKQHLELMEEQ
jgi:archaeosine-15-forming tRNA-guanine transglycosylase